MTDIIGYGRVNECKTLLVNKFIENKDYKIEKAALGGCQSCF